MPQSVVIDATSAATGSNPKSNMVHAIETATAVSFVVPPGQVVAVAGVLNGTANWAVA